MGDSAYDARMTVYHWAVVLILFFVVLAVGMGAVFVAVRWMRADTRLKNEQRQQLQGGQPPAASR